MSQPLDLPKFLRTMQKLLCEKVILTLTGLPRNKSLNYLGTSDCFEQQIIALVSKFLESFVVICSRSLTGSV